MPTATKPTVARTRWVRTPVVGHPPVAAIRTALTAAAVQVNVEQAKSRVVWGGAEWQREAYDHYDVCPELHKVAAIIGNALSRVRLVGVDIDPTTGRPGTETTQNPDVARTVTGVFGGPTGQSQMLKAYGLNLTIAGDCWTLCTDQPDVDGLTWEVIAITDVEKAGTTVKYRRLDGIEQIINTDRDLLFRTWQPHPRNRWEADSATRALLPVLRELAALSASVMSALQSRLAMNGLLVIPEEADPPEPPTGAGSEDLSSEDVYSDDAPVVPKSVKWSDAFVQIASANLSDVGSAGAALPLISTMGQDLIALIKQFDFSKPIDTQVETLRLAAINRIAVGMEMPPEILLGTADANHWGAWAISEAFLTSFLEPLLETICNALTVSFLHPALRMIGVPNPTAFAIGADVSDLRPEQQSAENADAAYTAGALSEERYLETLKFDPVKDAATVEERMFRLVMAMMSRGNPQTLEEIKPTLQFLFPNLKLAPPVPATGAPGPGVGIGDTPTAGRTPPTPTGGTSPTPAKETPAQIGPPASGPTTAPDHTPTSP